MFAVVLVAVGYGFFVSDGQPSALRGDALSTLGYVSNWWFVVSDQSYFAWFPSRRSSDTRGRWRSRSSSTSSSRCCSWPGSYGPGSDWRACVHSWWSVCLPPRHSWPRCTNHLTDASRAYYGTDTRAQALLLGAFLALAPP